MPRRSRKKKSDISQWPPLTFVSSPLYQAAPILEQEMAATNPVTAKTVPVDDLTETVWVSPQFSQRAHRRLRSSTSMCRRVNSASKASGMQPAASLNKRSKFRPLRFLSEEITESPSPSACHPKHLEPVRLEPLLAQTGEENACTGEDATNVGSPHTGQHYQFSRKASEVDKENAEVHSSLTIGRNAGGEERVLRSGRSIGSASSCRERRNSLCENENVDMALLPGRLCVDTEDLNHAALAQQPVTPDSVDCVPCPTSFISTPSRAEITSNESCHDLNRSQTADPLELVVTTKTDSGNCLRSVNKSGSHECVTATCDNLTCKVRDSSHGCSWAATPPRIARDSKLVLALDTPLCDYGLSLRQRQLKYGLRETSHEPHAQPP
ncbi:hypothetical protein EGW08_005832 [Elysia chlorotica]|uniref:Uncharacterized protein n=1 Tax=Elysia chlorotica TaxID=188477 RepID=A0A3S1BLF3_ELYCH|nr:hypothetical protein EGW08_005832 [Elysia chlorotica]